MKFTDHKVSTWLSVAFGSLVVLMLGSSGLALNYLSNVHDTLETVVQDNNVRLKISNAMSEANHIASRVVRSIVLLEDQADKERELQKITEANKDYDRQWEALQKFPPSEAGRAIRARIAQAAQAARALEARVLQLGMQDKDAEATALLMHEANPAAMKLQDAIDENLHLQETNNQQRFEAAQADYVAARNLLAFISALAVSAALVMGYTITRGLVLSLGAEPGEAASLAQFVAAGDLSVAITLRKGDASSMMAQLKSMQESLARVVSTVRSNAEGVATASAQIAQGNIDLSSRTEEQASALEQTAASMEELSSTVRQNADNARQGNQLALSASTVAVKGGDVVGQVVETMKGINDSSRKIADIISLIDGIAFQTNILALNAAVEAARAGEQGRGFAVVAGEVRSLAGRSAEAAKEIKALINTSVERVAQGTSLVDQAGATMAEVVSAIRRVTDIMGEISAASSEQSAGVAQVGEAVTQMDQATQQNAALVEESAAAAESLRLQAQQLVEAVAVFKLGQEHGLQQLQPPHAPPRAPLRTPLRVATAARPRFPAVEQRAPGRGKNIVRLAAAAPGEARARNQAATPPAPDNNSEWTSF